MMIEEPYVWKWPDLKESWDNLEGLLGKCFFGIVVICSTYYLYQAISSENTLSAAACAGISCAFGILARMGQAAIFHKEIKEMLVNGEFRETEKVKRS